MARQEQDCRCLAERRWWTVAGVCEDNDVSAYKTRVKRPEFEHLIEDLEGGFLDGLVVYDLDRFAWRRSTASSVIEPYVVAITDSPETELSLWLEVT